jgi:hypothetical protein
LTPCPQRPIFSGASPSWHRAESDSYAPPRASTSGTGWLTV